MELTTSSLNGRSERMMPERLVPWWVRQKSVTPASSGIPSGGTLPPYRAASSDAVGFPLVEKTRPSVVASVNPAREYFSASARVLSAISVLPSTMLTAAGMGGVGEDGDCLGTGSRIMGVTGLAAGW